MLLSLLPLTTSAQVNFDVKLSDKHQQKIQESKDRYQRLKRYKKYYKKDSTELAEKYAAEAREKLKLDSLQQLKQQTLAQLTPDSSMLEVGEDSLAWALETLNGTGHMEQYESLRAQYFPDSLKNMTADTVLSAAGAMATQRVEQEVGQLAAGQDLPNQQAMTEETMAGFTTTGNGQVDGMMEGAKGLDWYKPVEFDAHAEVDKLSKNVSAKQMAKAQARLTALKKKYVKVPSMNDMEGAVKRNSLKGEPLKRRIFIGGNFSLQAADPLIIDGDIQLGYKIHRDFVIGGGLVLREMWGTQDSLVSNPITESAFGYSAFVSHDIFKSFYAYGEWQHVRSGSLWSSNEDRPQGAGWEQAIYVGVGKEFAVAKFLNMTVTLLYDLNHKNNALHHRPWVMKVGYRLSEIALR